MNLAKDCYIYHKKAGDQFGGCYIPEISLPTKEFAVSPCYLDFTCASIGTQQKIDIIIDNHLIKQDDVPGTMFVLIYFLFASA